MKLKHSQLANLPDGKHPDGAGIYFRVWCSGTACLHDEPLATATHFGPFSGSLVIFLDTVLFLIGYAATAAARVAKDRGNRTSSITARRMISGDLLK